MVLNNLPDLQQLVMMVPGVLIGFTFHEFAHAVTATWFGDDTPRLQGRLSLNPLVHLDVLGTILIFVAGFGWARPVQVNVYRLHPRVLGDVVVSLAGIIMNLLFAVLFSILAGLGMSGLLFDYNNPVLNQTLLYAARINLFLAAFNLIPLPPLDGFHVFKYAFPRSMDHVVGTLYRMGPFALMLLFLSPLGEWFLSPILGGMEWLVMLVVRAVLGAISG